MGSVNRPVTELPDSRARIAGYERGLRDGYAQVKKADAVAQRWRRLALICGGIAMVLTIVALIEGSVLYFRH